MSALPESMPAAVYYGTRDLRIEDRAVPVAAAGELLLRVGAVGVCGTDSSEWDHGPTQIPLAVRHPASGHLGPMALGHEFSGTVVAVGEGVDPEKMQDRRRSTVFCFMAVNVERGQPFATVVQKTAVARRRGERRQPGASVRRQPTEARFSASWAARSACARSTARSADPSGSGTSTRSW